MDSQQEAWFLENIQSQIYVLQKINEQKELIQHPDSEVKVFFEEHPKIADKIKNDPNFDLNKIIEYKIEWKELYMSRDGEHEDKKFFADKRIGMHLADRFLFPKEKKRPSYQNIQKANQLLSKKVENNKEAQREFQLSRKTK